MRFCSGNGSGGRPWLGRLEKVAAPATCLLAALESMYGAHIDLIVAHPGVVRMLFDERQLCWQEDLV
jgi:fructose-1,6-bisphosphatase